MGVEARNRWGPRPPAELPRLLVLAGGWAWRLLAVGVAAYALVRVLALVWLVVVPVVAAVLLASLLRPLTRRLVRWHVPGPLAALLTLLATVAVLGGVGFLVQQRVAAQLSTLVDDLVGTVQGMRPLLARLGMADLRLDRLQTAIVDWLQAHRDQALNAVQTGAGVLVDAGTMILLTLFVTFFFLYDGERVWRGVLLPFRDVARQRMDRAGRAAWEVVTAYVHGTAVIATIHGTVIGLVLYLLGVPLALPLAVLVFLGSFVPIAGALVAGGIAVLVTLAVKGWVAGLILFVVLIAEDQLEGHVLQPLIVGRYVRLHPLLIGLALAVGSILGGIVGAVVAVPVAAVLRHTVPVLLGHPAPADEPGDGDRPGRAGGDDTGDGSEQAGAPARDGATRTGGSS
jgi:predicted PurR-regulated permease PerM